MEPGEIVGWFCVFCAIFLGVFALVTFMRREATKGTDHHGALLCEIRDMLRSREAPVEAPRFGPVVEADRYHQAIHERDEAQRGSVALRDRIRELEAERDKWKENARNVVNLQDEGEWLHEERHKAIVERDRCEERVARYLAERDEARTNADNSRREAERLVEECEARMADEREVLAGKLEWFRAMISGTVGHLHQVQAIHSQMLETIGRFCAEVRKDEDEGEDFGELVLDDDGGVTRS